MRRLIIASGVAAMVLVGCKAESPPAKMAPGAEVTLRGALVAGAECPMIEITGGRRFSLGGDLGKFKVGDRVCLRGTVAAMSICMAGEATVEIKAIGPENDCP
jgi:hypothetical protein